MVWRSSRNQSDSVSLDSPLAFQIDVDDDNCERVSFLTFTGFREPQLCARYGQRSVAKGSNFG